MKKERGTRDTMDTKGYDGAQVGQRRVPFLRFAGPSLACTSCKEADGGESQGRRREDGGNGATNISLFGRRIWLFPPKWTRKTMDMGTVQCDGDQGMGRAGMIIGQGVLPELAFSL